MDAATAHRINGAMLSLGMADIRLELDVEKVPDALATLATVTLADMVAAARTVEAENEANKAQGDRDGKGYRFTVVPDDRLVAAIYAWLHYAAPSCHQVGDNDESCLTIRVGDGMHGLIAWSRPAKQFAGVEA